MSVDSSKEISQKTITNKADSNSLFWNVPWSVLGAVSTGICIEFFTFGVVGILGSYLDTDSISTLLILYSLTALIAIGGIAILIKVTKFSWRNFLGKFRAISLVWVPLYYVLYLALTAMAAIVAGIFINYDQAQEQSFGLESASGLGIIGVFIVLVILPPISEELIFRGMFYRGLRTKWGRIIPALITSALFGLAHGQWNVGIDTFVLSLVLIFSMERSKSLWTPMAVHGLKNLIAFTFLYLIR